ncbi:hypothetical protein HOU26_gp42 [Escherichia phage IMM-002]|uniref:Uncharacterized protein n=1 Tax=Escherichia phage IMM-002 TaxID=2041760 RepID=A0A384WIH8_9CAUD|nr:hypothetical protein HOU26_gp42 [Escherichia phage IMM-002]ATI17001.1 hypothetical protein [Escherichia phage IMM-002]
MDFLKASSRAASGPDSAASLIRANWMPSSFSPSVNILDSFAKLRQEISSPLEHTTSLRSKLTRIRLVIATSDTPSTLVQSYLRYQGRI